MSARQFRLSEKPQYSLFRRFRYREENLTVYQEDCFSLHDPFRYVARRQVQGYGRGVDVLAVLFFKEFDGEFFYCAFRYSNHILTTLSFLIRYFFSPIQLLILEARLTLPRRPFSKKQS